MRVVSTQHLKTVHHHQWVNNQFVKVKSIIKTNGMDINVIMFMIYVISIINVRQIIMQQVNCGLCR